MGSAFSHGSGRPVGLDIVHFWKSKRKLDETATLFVPNRSDSQSLFAQTSDSIIAGSRQGALLFGQGKARVMLFVVARCDGVYGGTMVNLDSGALSDIGPVTLAKGRVEFESKDVGLRFEGTLSLSGDDIQGKFTQGETTGDLTFTRENKVESRIADEYEKKEFMIPMRDGVHLHTTVFSPKVRPEALPF
jgi:hypothetical protein